MNFIRKLAVKSYRKELIQFTEMLSTLDKKKLANFLAYSVWIRSILQIEGHINPMRWIESSCDDVDLEPEFHAYPFMLKDIKQFIKFLNKQNQKSKSLSLMLWAHSLQAVIRPELNNEINSLWKLIMTSKKYWHEEIQLMYEEDISLGIEPNFVDKTAKMAKEIIKCLPPKQILNIQ